MLRKYSIRLRETNKQIEQLAARAGARRTCPKPDGAGDRPSRRRTLQAEAMAYFISKPTRQRVPGVQDTTR